MSGASSGAGHLPKQRAPGAPPAQLPRQRKGTTPQQRGRYPDFDVLAQARHWDQATREAVLARVQSPPPIRFFSSAEERTLRAFCDVAMAQDREPRVPVLEMVDAKLFEGRLDGFRFHDMPEDPETWRLVAVKLDQEAQARGGGDGGFAAAGGELQCQIVDAFSQGELDWGELPSKKAWSVVMRGVLSEFYSHPWAWNEIGFGGPAYPRGFARLGAGQRERWETPPEFEVDPVRDVHERGLE
jgi:gluconate 2-dehydrogenase subunit 3-like protein